MQSLPVAIIESTNLGDLRVRRPGNGASPVEAVFFNLPLASCTASGVAGGMFLQLAKGKFQKKASTGEAPCPGRRNHKLQSTTELLVKTRQTLELGSPSCKIQSNFAAGTIAKPRNRAKLR